MRTVLGNFFLYTISTFQGQRLPINNPQAQNTLIARCHCSSTAGDFAEVQRCSTQAIPPVRVVFSALNSLAVHTMAPIQCKLLSAAAAPGAHIQVRVFGGRVEHIQGTKNPFSKWVALAIDSKGNTASIYKKFFGDSRNPDASNWLSKLPSGTCVDINPESAKGKGCKGNDKNQQYTCATGPVDIEIVSKTNLKIIDEANLTAPIPKRPVVFFQCSKLPKLTTEKRIAICGIVQEVKPLEHKPVQQTARKQPKRGQQAPNETEVATEERPVSSIKILDDSDTDAWISFWGDFASEIFTVGEFVALYQIKVRISPDGNIAQSTDDTVIVQVGTAPDHVSAREDAIISQAQRLQATVSTTSGTRQQIGGGGAAALVEGKLRLVAVKTVAIADDIKHNTQEKGFHLEGVSSTVDDTDNITNSDGRLWTKLNIIDTSSKFTCYATEEALLQLSGLSVDQFKVAAENGDIPLPRANLRISRLLKTLNPDTPYAYDVVNTTIQKASPAFVFPTSQSVESKYDGAVDYADGTCLLPTTVAALSHDDQDLLVRVPGIVEPVVTQHGVLLMLEATARQKPLQCGCNVYLKFEQLKCCMTTAEEAPQFVNVIFQTPLETMIDKQMQPGDFGIFHIVAFLMEDEKEFYVADQVHKPQDHNNISREDAVRGFNCEILATGGVVKTRRVLKRERSHIDPSVQEEVIATILTPNAKHHRTSPSIDKEALPQAA